MLDARVVRQCFCWSCCRDGSHTDINWLLRESSYLNLMCPLAYMGFFSFSDTACRFCCALNCLVLGNPLLPGSCPSFVMLLTAGTLSPAHQKLIPARCSVLTSKYYEVILYLFILKINPPALLYINTSWDVQESCVCSTVFIHLEQRLSSPCLAQNQA